MTIAKTIQRAEAELSDGRLWRAKEILASSLSAYGYSREIYLAYANVLVQLGDQLEAGRFYLLSVDEPDDQQRPLVELFLKRHQKDDWMRLLLRFPKPARLSERGNYPTYLRDYLVTLQAPSIIDQEQLKPNLAYERPNWLLPMTCLSVTIIAIVCVVVGAHTLVGWIIDML